MKKYIKTHFWDFILCFFISVGLSVNVFAGYEMTDPWSGNLLVVAGVVFTVLALFFLAYFSRKTMLISIIVTVVVLIMVIFALQSTDAIAGAKSMDENPLLFWIIVIATPSVAFWTTRLRAGIIILFLSGSLMIAAFDILKYPVSGGGYFIFVFCSFALFMYRVYCISSMESEIGKISFHPYFIQSIIVTILGLLLAGGAYYGVVRPLSPPTDEIKLSTQLMSMEILEKAGVSCKTVIPSDEILSNKLEDSAKTFQNQNKKDGKEQDNNRNNHKQQKDIFATMAITYKNNSNSLWIVVVTLIMILVGAVFIKYYSRKKWYGNLINVTREDGAIELYLYFVKRMEKAGFKRPADMTLLEYAIDSQKDMARFSVYHLDFLQLTQIYLSILYGYQNISDEQYELFHDFYKEFHRNLRKEMGYFKYCTQYFIA